METVSQSAFITALLDPNQDAPIGLRGPANRPAGKRFSVYRNNVAVSLTEALTQSFPILTRIVGPEFFDALAGVFLRQNPPSSPLMMYYGGEMPAFLEGFEPVNHLPYLSDVARMEVAIRTSYHASDATPIAPDTFENIAPDALMAASIRFAPAVHLLRSDWPIYDIYRVNTQENAPAVQPRGQNVLITRLDFDPQITPLSNGGAAFVQKLMDNATFAEAFDAANADQDFDLTQVLGTLLSGGAITEINPT